MMKNKVLNYIIKNRMIEQGDTVVVGVSGGADSMCLLHMLDLYKDELKYEIVVVHVHHGIRGESADRDAEFVARYCEGKGILAYVKYYDVPNLASDWGMSMEEAGRKVRYDAFKQILNEVTVEGKGKVAVAHNKDDLAETVLFNLFRGSDIKGMAGIVPVRDEIIRPVLCLSRNEIENYCENNGISYITDETNLTEEYTRNRLRLSIIPKILEDINVKAVEHIASVAENIALTNDYMEAQCEEIYKECVTVGENTVSISCERYAELHEAMKGRLVKRCIYEVAGQAKDITRKHINSVVELFYANVGKQVNLPYNILAKRSYDVVIVEKLNSVECRHTEEKTKARLKISKDIYSDTIFEENKYTKWIECDIMKCDLRLRTREPHDYIVVDENGSKKKLKDFFIDRKIPKEEREKVLLLANGNEIVWVVGYRLSYAYRVKRNSENIYRIDIEMEDI